MQDYYTTYYVNYINQDESQTSNKKISQFTGWAD